MNGDFENFKEQVRSTADMVEIISGYVPLKKKGQNYWGCCPFHGEKTPSFSVNPGKSMFYCFGCHEGGDIFKFIMKIENCSFMDALKLLAGRYGIPIPEKQKTAAEIAREKQRNSIYSANELASKFFQACLTKTAYGEPALAYLAGRGIGKEIIAGFGIGYALNNFTALVSSLAKRGCQPQVLEAAGLAARGRDGYYDKFRNRVIIPIRDARGRIVGFGGRVLDNSTPKYLNTAETQWFNKRRVVFGLDIAFKAISKIGRAVVVECYMDAISLHAAGFDNVVASMGTAFSQEQAKLLQRLADEVIFCYDSDSAGRKASVRAVSIAREAGLKVRIAGVPDGKDPDEYVRQHGSAAFAQVLAAAQNGIDFQIDETILQNNIANLAGKVEAVSNILPFLLECQNEIESSEHIRRLAQRRTIDEGLIALLSCLLEPPQLCDECRAEVKETGVEDAVLAQLFDRLCELGTAYTTDKLNNVLDDASQTALARILAHQLPEGDMDKLMQDCFRQMRRLRLEKEYEKHRLLADEYERSADERFLSELMESQRIKNEIKKLYGNQNK